MTITDKRSCYLFPKSLADFVESVTRPIFKAQGLAGSRILTEWESIVGEQLAKHTLPEKLSFPKGKKTGGTLVISTENGFATELQHMQPLILERLAGYFGYLAISRIVISHTWLAVNPASREAAQDPVPTQRFAQGSSLSPPVFQVSDDITDPELKTALQSLARTLSGESS